MDKYMMYEVCGRGEFFMAWYYEGNIKKEVVDAFFGEGIWSIRRRCEGFSLILVLLRSLK